ncbi:MAG: hypothetical protein BWX95_02671 [Bacteroidetes bacterium ADurb.Bin141]|nr:MAG: hypothetical protein BWX95_02671 [Bacteroidetes bacterium ADurb.Bin141]
MKYFIALKSIIKLLVLLLVFSWNQVSAQGKNSVYLLGYNAKARMTFTSTTYSIIPESRQIPFEDTQGNISDENGNILMSSNGVYIADATGDTMLNGGGLNPGWAVNNFPGGLPQPNSNLFLPLPGDTNKFILFHQAADININLACPYIFYSLIDISLNSGFGEVVSKNNVALAGAFGWGFAACKHGNGRDWWVTAMADLGNGIHVFLVTPDTVQYMGLQTFPITGFQWGYAGQPVFSPNGEKFAFGGSYGINGMNYLSCISLFSFDRCNGLFTLDSLIDYSDNYISASSAFSSNSQYLYFASSEKLYQFNTDSIIVNPYQLVATNDVFPSPTPPFYTNFALMYLAANGKIYISSGSSVKHLHEMNYPDSAGIACDVQLHNVFTNCFFIGVPNHPNYYLGRLVGSPCDTLTGIHDLAAHDFRFSISPNPNNGNFRIMYLLPQNKSGTLQIFNITGKEIYHQNLPPWSTLQYISLPKIADGVYQCTITSNNQRVNKKLVVVRE